MKILVTGASGFIGSRLVRFLLEDGHRVVAAGRRPVAGCGFVEADFSRDHSPADWAGRLDGIDAVVNAVGILRESGGQTFEALHVRGPCALFEACRLAGVRRVVQVSALGADERAESAYHRSKKSADDFLLALGLDATVVQPSLVYGAGGASARLFTGLATLPRIPLPGQGGQRVQPVHLDDLARAIARLVVAPHSMVGMKVPIVGPCPLALREFIAELRAALGLPPAGFVPVPMTLVRWAAAAGRFLPGALLDSASLRMLERGNTAPATQTAALLGGPPRPVSDFIGPSQADAARALGRLWWCLPLLRWSVAAVWIVTGLLSLGLYPVEDSLALLHRFGAGEALAPWLLYSAGLLDLALGIAALARPTRWVWAAQGAVMLGYTALLSWRLPEFWLHPFGPLLKNLPLLGAIALLWAFEEKKLC